jgi:hypothetical protein
MRRLRRGDSHHPCGGVTDQLTHLSSKYCISIANTVSNTTVLCLSITKPIFLSFFFFRFSLAKLFFFPYNLQRLKQLLVYFLFILCKYVDLYGQGVIFSLRYPKFADSNPARVDGFFYGKLSGWESCES